MEKVLDIRKVKNQLRVKYRSIRENIIPDEKRIFDEHIYNRLIDFKYYKESKTVLCFVSKNIEIDTHRFLRKSLKDNKIVGVPACMDKKGNMAFFEITDFNDLIKGHFGLLEPNISRAKKIVNFENSICIIPGFAFDNNGYRIGFGKGYYDRFLQKYIGIKIGVCYNSCIANSLPHGRYDIKADFVITQKYNMTISKGAKNER